MTPRRSHAEPLKVCIPSGIILYVSVVLFPLPQDKNSLLHLVPLLIIVLVMSFVVFRFCRWFPVKAYWRNFHTDPDIRVRFTRTSMCWILLLMSPFILATLVALIFIFLGVV